jgi:hypothetical protein
MDGWLSEHEQLSAAWTWLLTPARLYETQRVWAADNTTERFTQEPYWKVRKIIAGPWCDRILSITGTYSYCQAAAPKFQVVRHYLWRINIIKTLSWPLLEALYALTDFLWFVLVCCFPATVCCRYLQWNQSYIYWALLIRVLYST